VAPRAAQVRANLFTARQAEAVKEQEKVLAHLATITPQLKRAAEPMSGTSSADEPARLAEQVQKARAALLARTRM
jgi:hypothetical protein